MTHKLCYRANYWLPKGVAFRFLQQDLALSLILLILMVKPAVSSAAPIENRTNSSALFKRFVAEPPIIQELIYTMDSVRLPKYASNNAREYRARWQPNALLVEEIGPSEKTDLKGNRFKFLFRSGKYDDFYWQSLNEIDFCSYRSADGNIVADTNSQFTKKNSVYNTYVTARSWLADILNMGIMDVGVGSIKWVGNSFDALSQGTGGKILGVLSETQDGKPLEMRLQYLHENSVYHYSVMYFFEADIGLSFIPSRIMTTFQDEGTNRFISKIVIKSLKTSETPLGAAAFDFKHLVRSGKSQLFTFTNDAMFAVSTNGLTSVLPLSARKPLPGRADRNISLLLFLIATACFPPVLLLIKKLKQNKKGNHKSI